MPARRVSSAGMEACRQVGENARPVAQLADELGVCWWTVMAGVIEYGTPLVDDPARVGPVDKLGVDETSWLAANASHPTLYAAGLFHRGRKRDPLYRIRKLLLSGHERLDERGHDRMLLGLRAGDPHDEVLGAWLAKESTRDVRLTNDPARRHCC
jgi:hypothetical protein